MQEIKDRLNVADVIGGYITTRKSGANFKAVCPFHNEKSPSLMISPQKQIWHCFGCGEGGDVFGFVMRYENVEFKEALKILAAKAGVKLPEYRPQNPQEQSEKELLFRINNFAARFYHELLLKDKRGSGALEYLIRRGLTEGTIKKWQIGFAPDDFHVLEQALAQKKVSIQDLVKAGVSAKNERGQVYDRFRGRVTFPIYDINGETVGFSARILQDDGKSAKYVNSPETVIYNKSNVLFGLNFAKNAIRKGDEAVVVEGQMDCIAAHQAGFENVVASSGTALTSQQLGLLARLTKNLKFCFDADTAGQAASQRAGELALKQGFRLKVIVLDKVKDPDELIKRSPGLWQKAVAEAQWFLDWQMDFAVKNFSSDLVEQKHFLSQNVVPLLSFVSDPLEQDHYLRRMMDKFNISERTIRDQIKKFSGGKTDAARPAQASPAAKANVLEKEILGGMLLYGEFADSVRQNLSPADFSDLEVRQLAEQAWQGQGELVNQDSVAKEAVFMVESLVETLDGRMDQLKRHLEKSLAMLKVQSIKNKQQEVSAELRKAESEGDKERAQELTRQFADITTQRIYFEKLI